MKKRITAAIMGLVLALALMPAMPVSAEAATDHAVSIDGMTTSDGIRRPIQAAINAASPGDTVTVTGTATTEMVTAINIPGDITVVWKASLSTDYSSSDWYSGIFSFTGTGTFEVAEGGSLTINGTESNNIAINVYDNNKNGAITINITGGTVYSSASSGFDCHTIGSWNSTLNINVNSGGRILAEGFGTGNAYGIDLTESVGHTTVSDGGSVEVTSDKGVATAMCYNAGSATVTGGTIRAESNDYIAAGIYIINGDVDVSGGTVTTTSGSGNPVAIRLGDNELESNDGAKGTVNISGGTITVKSTSETATSNPIGVSIWNDGDEVIMAGGKLTVHASGPSSGAYGIHFQSRGNATVTGGEVTATATEKSNTHSIAIRMTEGFAKVTGGKVTAASSFHNPFAIYIARSGAAAFLTGTCTGTFVVERGGPGVPSGTGIIAEIGSRVIDKSYRGSDAGIEIKASNGIDPAGAVWDNTSASDQVPHIAWTGTGASGFALMQWGKYFGEADTDREPPNEALTKDLVTRMYENVLLRDASLDQEGLNAWTERMMNRDYTGAELAFEFYFSVEFLTADIDNEEFIENLYLTFFGRDANADPDGKAHWLAQAEAGMSRLELVTEFIDCDEFRNLCEAADIDVGDIAPKQAAQVRGFVWGFYYQCFGRAPDEDGLKAWTERLIEGEQTGTSIAREFVISEEMQNKIEDGMTDEEFVVALYTVMLGRAPDDEGREAWTGRMGDAGDSKYEWLFEQFAVSEEFGNVCERYGITR